RKAARPSLSSSAAGVASGAGKPARRISPWPGWQDGSMARPRVLYVYSRDNTFTRIDRQVLAERYEVVDYFQYGLRPRLRELWRGVRSCDLVVGWFASW